MDCCPDILASTMALLLIRRKVVPPYREGRQVQFFNRPVFNNIRSGMRHDQGKDQTLLMPEYRHRLHRAISVAATPSP